MTNKLTSFFARIAKTLLASSRGRNLVQHGDLTHQFALVAPLGGGAVIALQQALSPERDHSPRRGRHCWGWAV